MPATITGFDVTLRRLLTYVAILAALALALLAFGRARSGDMPGAAGGLLVMAVIVSVGAKFAAETYFLSSLGGEEDSPRERAARRMVESHSGLMKTRYALGALGGVILPLSVQALAVGFRYFVPVTDPMIPAVTAGLALALLVPGELAERRLWRLATQEEPAA